MNLVVNQINAMSDAKSVPTGETPPSMENRSDRNFVALPHVGVQWGVMQSLGMLVTKKKKSLQK